MLISPPFLPERAPGQTDEQWLAVAMRAPASRLPDTQAPEGSFPLSHNLAWHNGMHLQAPTSNGGNLPARAIADGRVVFVSSPTSPNDNADDPQNYNPFDRPGTKSAAWTDNGCVIIEHRTTIGAAGSAETEVVFFSLYMHLSALARVTPSGQRVARELQAGDTIWRKDEVGQPGQIYGHGGQIHFEICFDTANLQRLIGRAPGWVEPAQAPAVLPAPSADGRTDSIFGSLYVYLPASAPIHRGANMPANHLRAVSPAATLGAPVWVRMTYDRGGCTFETYDERGGLVAAMPTEAEAEYALYQSAVARHGALPDADRAQSSPSGWYELLRFGRNIGHGPDAADRDPLPASAAHWRRIAGADGQPVWADLNAEGSFKFSDADFLPVMGWNCIDDDTSPQDQRCDSDRLKRLIRDPDPGNAGRMEPEQLATRLGRDDVQKNLMRVFCKFPSEWEKGSITARYQFVQELEPFKEDPDAWPRLEAHLKAVCFDSLPVDYLAADWRVHPWTFLLELRRCGWLSLRELSQLLPRRHGPGPTQLSGISWATAQSRFGTYVLDLNRTFRKYGIQDATRQSHFLAQTYIETALWQTMEEFGRAHQQRRHDGTLYWPAPAMEYYQAFYGRGIMQLTWAGNFAAYGSYRSFVDVGPGHVYAEARISHVSRHYWSDPRDQNGRVVGTPRAWYPRFDPSNIDRISFNACDSGAHYWVSKDTGHGLIGIHRVCDQGLTEAAVGRVSVLVNGGGYGFAERQAYARYIERFRGDGVDAAANRSFNVAHGRRTHAVYVDFTPQRP